MESARVGQRTQLGKNRSTRPSNTHALRQPVLEALELSVAVQLDSTRAEDALRLARLLARAIPDAARRAYAVAAAPGAPPELAAAARREAARLPDHAELP